MSLESVLAHYIGHPMHWPQALRALAEQQIIDNESVARGTLQWAFGRLIGNSDMHASNLAFFTDTSRLQLTPTYDMLPMSLAPNGAGYMRQQLAEITLDSEISQSVWLRAADMAEKYWQHIAADQGWSDTLRGIARDAGEQLANLRSRISRMA